jgi:DNA-binding response OmpR family regulator
MAEAKKKILWVDDEIELLRPHIMFLEERGYQVTGVTSGEEAVALSNRLGFDVVLLDEMMPGMGGLETLERIKVGRPSVPVIMITKNEEEELMDEAIGKRIDDYLTKPVNASQIFMACKRLLEARQIQEQMVVRDYVPDFNQIASLSASGLDWDGWAEVHSKLSAWDLRLDEVGDEGLKQSHMDQKKELNIEFCKYVERNYADCVHSEERPVLSVDLFSQFVAPSISSGKRVYFVVIDCMRLDQWYCLEPLLQPYFDIARHVYYSILPTATPYARNAIFSGMFPGDIARKYPQRWEQGESESSGRNRFERDFMEQQIARLGLKVKPGFKYFKVYNAEEGNSIKNQVHTLSSLPLVAMVFNFVDILAHGRSESEILQELAPDEAGFRSLMRSWFAHSSLFEILKTIANQDAEVIITTDHGSVLGRRAALVKGDRGTSTNLRYKFGNNIGCDEKQAVNVKNPADFKLPSEGLNKNYLMAKEDYYFVYPTRFHEFEKHYKGSFQHGGISMEEMIVPCAVLTPRR